MNSRNGSVHDQNLHRVENVVSFLGHAAAGPLAADLAYRATGYSFENKDRVRIGQIHFCTCTRKDFELFSGFLSFFQGADNGASDHAAMRAFVSGGGGWSG